MRIASRGSVSCAGICYGWDENEPYEAVAVSKNMKIVKKRRYGRVCKDFGEKIRKARNPKCIQPEQHTKYREPQAFFAFEACGMLHNRPSTPNVRNPFVHRMVIYGNSPVGKALTGVFSVAHQSDIARMGACVCGVSLR